jgi:hypothetical protein
MLFVFLGIKSNVSDSQSSRSRSSKSWSDEATNEDELIINQIDLLKTNQIQDKYRCDQMILQHNNGPIDYEQIQLPIPTTKKYLTGFLKIFCFYFKIFYCLLKMKV